MLVTADGNSRALARELLAAANVDAVRLVDGTIEVETSDPEALQPRAAAGGARAPTRCCAAIHPVGDDLESVYAYLHERARGQGR